MSPRRQQTLRVQVEDAGADTAILRASGDMTLGETSELRTASNKVFESGKKNIILDMSGVRYIDSAGLGELVLGFARSRQQKAQYALTGLGPVPKDLLTNTHLIQAFNVFDSVDQAVAYFLGSHAAGTT